MLRPARPASSVGGREPTRERQKREITSMPTIYKILPRRGLGSGYPHRYLSGIAGRSARRLYPPFDRGADRGNGGQAFCGAERPRSGGRRCSRTWRQTEMGTVTRRCAVSPPLCGPACERRPLDQATAARRDGPARVSHRGQRSKPTPMTAGGSFEGLQPFVQRHHALAYPLIE
jgi:hypothetical protein